MGSTIRFNTFYYHFSSQECSRFAALEHVRRKRQEEEKEVRKRREKWFQARNLSAVNSAWTREDKSRERDQWGESWIKKDGMTFKRKGAVEKNRDGGTKRTISLNVRSIWMVTVGHWKSPSSSTTRDRITQSRNAARTRLDSPLQLTSRSKSPHFCLQGHN